MKILFIGVGAQSSTIDYFQSNMIITSESGKRLLLDCGSDIRFSLAECDINAADAGKKIDAVYVSHLHSDHIGGLEWLALSTYFSPGDSKCRLFAEENLMHDLWEHSLRGGLEKTQGRCMTLCDYFDCHPVSEDGSFQWEEINFRLVKMPHITGGCRDLCSYGLMIHSYGRDETVFISTDTQFHPELLAGIAEKAGIIFHDCETTPFMTTVHAHYNELRTLPFSIKQKMWLYHYQPGHEFKAGEDGFRGFVRKGQEFDFA